MEKDKILFIIVLGGSINVKHYKRDVKILFITARREIQKKRVKILTYVGNK